MGSKIFYLYNDISRVLVNWLQIKSGREFLNGNEIRPFEVGGFLHLFDISLVKVLIGFFNPVVVSNLIMMLAVVSAVALMYSLLRKTEGHSILISTIFSLLFIAQPYFLYRMFSLTHGLAYIFLFPLFLRLLIASKSVFLLAFVAFLSFGVNSYYGYFLAIISVLWFISEFIIGQLKFKQLIKRIFKFSIVFLVLMLLIFKGLLFSNTAVFDGYKFEGPMPQTSQLFRPIEDYYSFSFRPWYFFIPPERSVFFGELSDKLLKMIKNTGYYLAKDYAAEEMAGAYMGWHFILGATFVGYLILLEKYRGVRYKVFDSVYKNKKLIAKSFLTIFLILLISGPPSFTISGFEIYTPSYLLYYIAPVFRVLTRWSVVIFLFILVINSFLVQDLYCLMKNKAQRGVFIFGFVLLNFVIFAIRIPVIHLDNPPHEIAYFDEVTTGQVKYAVYPSADYYSTFWILTHKNYLINPKDYKSLENDFNSEDFSEQLVTFSGLEELRGLGGTYLIYYKDRISEKDLLEIAAINSDINSYSDVENFFLENFGEKVYDKEGVLIFKR